MTRLHRGDPTERQHAVMRFLKRQRKVISIVLVAVAIVLTVWRFRPTENAVVTGTWRMTVPVGKAMSWFADTALKHEGVGEVLSFWDEDQTVTVYCRFFEDNTYRVYADADDVITTLSATADKVVSYACEKGLPALIENGAFSDATTRWLLGLSGLTADTISVVLRGALDSALTPLYDALRTAMASPAQTGNRQYRTDRDRVYTALKKETPLEESVYVIWQFENDILRMSAGSLFDETGEFTWQRIEV